MAERTLETYKRDAIIREASKDLAETQVEKLKTLVADVDFERRRNFLLKKSVQLKESYFTKAAKSTDEEIVNEEDAFTAEASDSMSHVPQCHQTYI